MLNLFCIIINNIINNNNMLFIVLNIVSELLAALRYTYVEYYALLCVVKLIIDIPKEVLRSMIVIR